jgi:poly(hydroxyalkanoate) depolymerase family esterase
MTPIDPQKLYAANRAAILAARRGMADAQGRAAAPAAPPRPRPGRPREDGPPSGTGAWDVRAYEGPDGGRSYALYTPAELPAGPRPLVVVLHGCTQSPADVARGTRWNELADRHGVVVAYPGQTARHNDQACWNWFLPRHQRRGAGEPAVLAGLTREVAGGGDGAPIDPARVFVVGISAGGSMAAVLAATYPDVVRGAGVHSGLPYRTATSQPAAFEAMARGGGTAIRDGHEVAEAAEGAGRLGPLVVVHGTDDRVVNAVNGDELVAQWLDAHRLAGEELDGAPSVVHGEGEGGLAYRRSRWTGEGSRPVVEHLLVEGLGHAWSGGDRRGSYADPRGPDATQAMWDVFAEVGVRQRRRWSLRRRG